MQRVIDSDPEQSKSECQGDAVHSVEQQADQGGPRLGAHQHLKGAALEQGHLNLEGEELGRRADQVPAEIGSWDICLNLFERIPISHKASPMKLFEYLAMGKPVLTTDLDEVRRYDADFLYTVNTPAEAAAALRDIIEDPASSASRAAEGREWARASFDWKELANRFVELIERTTDRMN